MSNCPVPNCPFFNSWCQTVPLQKNPLSSFWRVPLCRFLSWVFCSFRSCFTVGMTDDMHQVTGIFGSWHTATTIATKILVEHGTTFYSSHLHLKSRYILELYILNASFFSRISLSRFLLWCSLTIFTDDTNTHINECCLVLFWWVRHAWCLLWYILLYLGL